MEKFRLFASCLPVKGFRRSVICDIQRSKIKFIPNIIFDLLIKNDGYSKDQILALNDVDNHQEIEEWLNYLVENEYAYWCTNPELFPKLNLDWESPELINNSIIDADGSSNHNYEDIFKQLDTLGCKHLQLRFFYSINYQDLIDKLRFLDNSRINTIEIIIKYSDNFSIDYLENIARSITRINNIIVHSSPKFERITEFSGNNSCSIKFITDLIDSHIHCGNISKEYFVLDQNLFLESQNFNSCLNKKISIDVNGDIKNCPSMISVYGNVKSTRLYDSIMTPGFQQIWKINKDQITICKDCEFRYICTDCRAFLSSDNSLDKPKKCSYNPYLAIWEDGIQSL
ncbi:MAG: grasp-with-spasm system SPASM domain peptide maturase [Crocinitomicaceae bacterium]|nr:grasp-with-spasm system SPASM domain peptide maturase [Crocinitomicaceae bacterium]MBK8924721.1 grasp-with-spasm system SPASM domain peptide maturase [Crocinitomicaceae bacterium]